MKPKDPSELLYDTEATLRLVDSAIHDMGELGGANDAIELEIPDAPSSPQLDVRDAPGSGPRSPIGLVGLSDLVARGYSEILGVLDSLRQSRSLLKQSSVERLQHTHDKLLEVNITTEVAATDILNGLERATSMVDELDALAEGDGVERGAVIRAALRDEMFALMGHMQFQDITSQQLSYASSVIADMEARLAEIARVFDPTAIGLAAPHTTLAPAESYDPEASALNRAERQAVADAIVATKRASE